MNFRYDINGLRAIAVIAVVLFHFNPAWVPGGFAGVDVFFVISGFLMTGIIFRGLENDSFNLFKFYVARANRIIPALAVLCLVLLLYGWFYLTPLDYKALSKHVASSVGFVSNVIYWRESGYFDAASHEKWLLHTWSLSVEWQFYILYPIVLVALKKYLSLENSKRLIVIGTVLGFCLSVVATMKWPNPAYYLLPTRAWEMMMGGVAFLYPWSLSGSKKKLTEIIGLALILSSYAFVSSDIPWPGHFALLPVLGAYLVIVSNQQSSFITKNALFQYLGKWSYSIYLWHWPIVVLGYYFDLQNWALYGLPLSVILGFLSFRFIEGFKFKSFILWRDFFRVKPVYMAIFLGAVSSISFVYNGFEHRMPEDFKVIASNAKPSPYRETCHIEKYQKPELSCEYFKDSVQWAILGDSHTVEIAYALAEKLKEYQKGLKHFSFSGCIPSYTQSDDYSRCSKWYNESVHHIINDNHIKNVVFNHRYSAALLGGHESIYPEIGTLSDKHEDILSSIDNAIKDLANSKDKVYVYLPIPEIKKPIGKLLAKSWLNNYGYENISGASLDFYKNRNKIIINHFKEKNYPDNVIFLNPRNAFCNEEDCFAVKDGKALYFDEDHPSVVGARLLVDLIPFDLP
ncbi:acyltransferase [Grimontia sp. AD028]|uniref:acyltransferase family protein n=1 Tax=Grimontia sp. AD028 TaxID=1581149 RepID=UPI00061B1DB3|nr:acyltransferase family protein [Grimontia sp. AD028]KKD60425.1 acyltransferase [Grimontia sp. AD028]